MALKWLGIAGMTLIALLMAACANTRGGAVSYNVQNFGVPDAPKLVVDTSNLPIATGDTLAVTVFQVDTLSHDYTVDLQGVIDMPLIGSVKVAGLTTDQARATIAKQLSQKYLQNPDVTVTLKSSTSRNVTVEGSVRQPGIYPVTANLTLLEAVALARGTSDDANPRRVAIFRTIGGQRMAAAFDLTSVRRGEASNPPVYSGDIIVVDGRRRTDAFSKILQSVGILALFRPI